MWFMGMECWYLGWEVRPYIWAEVSSQGTLNASQRRVEFGNGMGCLSWGVTQLDLSGRQVSLAALRKGDRRPKAVGRIVQIRMLLVA